MSLTDAKQAFRGALADYVADDEEQGYDEAVAESFPASDSPGHARHATEPPLPPTTVGAAARTAAARATRSR